MVFFNYTTMQATAKIVYYGPGLCGKTTNLQHIHQKTASKSRGEMVSLETETDRTLFFDLLPLDVGVIGGMKVRLQVYTVPGQVFYNATRKLVLKAVDGIVFVVDSQAAALEANVESLHNLDANLAELGLSLSEIPMVLQYNKRDIRQVLPVEALNEVLNPKGHPYFEAAALHGLGVFETLKAISRLALASVRGKITDDTKKKRPVAAATARPALVAEKTTPKPAPAAAVGPADLLAQLVADVPPEVEFAEEGTDKHAVRAVPTKALVDLQAELEELRTSATASSTTASIPSGAKEVERRLQEMLVSDRDSKQELKRKGSLEIPARLLKTSNGLKIHVAFEGEGGEELVRDVASFKLAGNKRLERLTLHLDLELKGKG